MRRILILIVFSFISFQTFSQCFVSAVATNTLCHNQCNGTAKVDSVSGTGPFTYVWSPNGETTDSIGGLCPGTYTVTMTDNVNCTSTFSVDVFQPTTLSLFTSSNPNSSCVVCDGSAFAIAGGGTSPYTYDWSTTATGTSITALCPGTYRVTATDFNGCQKIDSTAVGPPTPPTVSTSDVPASCSTCADGSSTANPSGGAGPYTYAWNDPQSQTTQTATGLLPATYTVCITDANSCTSCTLVTISFVTGIRFENADPAVQINPNPATTFINITGNFTAEVDYSVLNILGNAVKKGSFSLVNSSSEKITLSDLPSGIYFVKINSSKGIFTKKFVKQ